MSEKKMKINVVEIKGPDNEPPLTYYVRHYDPRQAKAWLLENNVSARVASQEDVIDMVNDGVTPVGPDLEPATGVQQDLVNDGLGRQAE